MGRDGGGAQYNRPMPSIFSGAFTPAQVREFDRVAIERHGIAAYELMFRAARATFEVACRRFPSARRWLVICGAGNNAGDGYVIARLALAAGIDVNVATVMPPAPLTGAAGEAERDFAAAGGRSGQFTAELLRDVPLVIDAMLGTGVARPLDGPWRHAVEAVNASECAVVAVDLPSGLDGATGSVLGAAVCADVTVTYIALKTGLFLAEGPDHAGDVELATLDVPPEILAEALPRFRRFEPAEQQALLPRRPRSAHKGDFGHVLVIGGNHGLAGAARLCGEAALRAGAGLVSVATRPEHAAALVAARPELMCRGVASGSEIEPLLARASVVAVGPGLGQDDWARSLFLRALESHKPLVLDADALNLLAAAPVRRDDWVLTPHPGEAGRLLGQATRDVQRERLQALDALIERYGGVVLLKGRGTLVGVRGAIPWVIDAGNPGMATGGMGDVLTGLIAGILAQTEPPRRPAATACAAWIHAAAADAAARHGGERGLIAGDLFAELRPWLNPSS